MLKILIAVDDLAVADMVEETLIKAGYEASGMAARVAQAVALGSLHKPDFAVIDVNLPDGSLGTELADDLCADGRLGMLYATAHMLVLTPQDTDASPGKPFNSADLLRGIAIVADIVVSGKAH
jgi:DNA-binding response OmpR family regulator